MTRRPAGARGRSPSDPHARAALVPATDEPRSWPVPPCLLRKTVATAQRTVFTCCRGAARAGPHLRMPAKTEELAREDTRPPAIQNTKKFSYAGMTCSSKAMSALFHGRQQPGTLPGHAWLITIP